MKTRHWRLGCLVTTVVVVLIGGLAVFLARVPEVTDQLPLGVSSAVVTLSAPSNDAQVPMNQITTISAEALGSNPIAALELWIDGTPSGTQNAPPGSNLNQFTAFWTWTPASEGEHTLLVRAIDTDHNIGMSNIVRVTASNDANVQASVAVQAKAGDTVSSLAKKIKVDPQQIIDLNPQVDPSSTITPGEAITVPIPMPPTPTPTAEASPSTTPEPPEPPGNPSQPPANVSPNKYQVWWNQNIFKQFAPIKVAAAPDLAASAGAGKCSIDLYIYDKSDNEDGFFLYRLDPNAFSFNRIATLDAHSGAQPIHYVDPVPTGKYQYYVSSFDAMGESPSKIVMAGIIEPCVAPQQQGLQLSNAKVTVSQPVDRIYCYLQVGDGLWKRIPPGAASFITTTKPGEFDLSQYLKSIVPPPAPPEITLHLECWGWKGDTLIYLGEATETIKQGLIKISAPNWQLLGNLAAQTHVLDIQSPEIAPPINAKLTTDPNECIKHFPNNPVSQSYAATQCPKYVASGYNVLTWDWSPDGCSSGTCTQDIQGYQIYMIRLGQANPTLISNVPNRDMTIAAFPPLSLGWEATPQAFIRAYKGTMESPDSNQVPLSMRLRTYPIGPTDTLSRYHMNYENCFTSSPPLTSFYGKTLPAGSLVAGFEHSDLTCDFYNVAYRGAVLFPLTQISPAFVGAHLKFTWVDSFHRVAEDVATNTGNNVSCASELAVATQDWRGNPWGDQPIQPAIPGFNYSTLPHFGQLPSGQGPYEWDVDVTPAVKEWLQGTRPDYGFVIAGPNDWVGQDWGNELCASAYDNFVLEITDYEP